jgi:hypothetical protein
MSSHVVECLVLSFPDFFSLLDWRWRFGRRILQRPCALSHVIQGNTQSDNDWLLLMSALILGGCGISQDFLFDNYHFFLFICNLLKNLIFRIVLITYKTERLRTTPHLLLPLQNHGSPHWMPCMLGEAWFLPDSNETQV